MHCYTNARLLFIWCCALFTFVAGNMLSSKALVQSLQAESFLDLPVTKEPASSKRCTGSECYPRTDLVSTSKSVNESAISSTIGRLMIT